MMEDDKQLIPAITSDIVVSDPGQVKSDGRREVEVLRAVGTLVTISSVLPSKGQVLDAQNHCEVEPVYARRISRELASSALWDMLCRLLPEEAHLCSLHEEGEATPGVF